MATKDQTLTIKDFKGVSRYFSSPNQKPNKQRTLKNLYPVNKGELGVCPGVSSLVASGTIPGLSSIKDMDYLKQPWGTEGWVVHYQPTGSLPVPSGHTYTTQGAASSVRGVKIQFVGPGGTTSHVVDAAKSFGATGLLVTLPTNIPTYVHCIHFYVEVIAGGTTGIMQWTGTAWRRQGSFAASIILVAPPTSGAVGNTITEDEPTGFNVSFGTSGNLEGGRTYYFGVSPWIYCSAKHVISNGYASGVTKFAVTVPVGKNSIFIDFTGMAGTAGDSVAIGYSRSILFMGATPEDLLPCYTSTDGTVLPCNNLPLGAQFQIKDLPVNSNLIARSDDISAGAFTGEAPSNRAFMTWTIAGSALPSSLTTADISTKLAACFIQTPYAAATHIELYPSGIGYSLDSANPGTVWSGSLSLTAKINSAALQSRIYFVNGSETPWYTNGIVLKSVVRDYQTAKLPITETIIAFQEGLVFSGGRSNFSNTEGTAVYTQAGNPWSVTATPSATPAYNFILANQGDNSKIVGLGVFSQNLSDTGPSSFLLIGKEEATISWNGGRTASDQIVSQIGKAVGWSSSKSFVLTPWGPFLFGRDNIYYCNGTDMKQAGIDVAEIIQAITPANYQYCRAAFVKNRAIFAYRDTANIDRELWADFREDDESGIQMTFSGPHELAAYTDHAVAQVYGTDKFYRVSYLSDVIYRRDVPSTFTNVGSPISWTYQSHDMPYGNDEFKKLLKAFYVRAKVNAATTVTITLRILDKEGTGGGLDVTTDSEETIVETMVLPFTGVSEIYRLFQKQFASRYAGSLFNATISASTSTDFRIVSMAWVFKIQGRRLL